MANTLAILNKVDLSPAELPMEGLDPAHSNYRAYQTSLYNSVKSPLSRLLDVIYRHEEGQREIEQWMRSEAANSRKSSVSSFETVLMVAQEGR